MHPLIDEARRDASLYLVAAVLLVTIVARTLEHHERRRLLIPLYLTLLHLALLPAVALTEGRPLLHDELRLVALLSSTMAFAGAGGILLFGRLLPLIGLTASGILRDLIMAAVTVVAGLSIAHRLSFSLHGIIATSAVLTAVIGFSLQEVLSNIMGGLSLQLDRSVVVGAWVKVGDVGGRVMEVRWRHTAIETRNGDLVLMPNTLMTKGPVTLLARSARHLHATRRWVWFNVDFRYPPPDVIAAVECALHGHPIPGVSAAPLPNCVLMELGESYARYAVRYWLTDLAADDPTDSEVRIRVHFALARAAIPLSMPAVANFVTEDTSQRRERKDSEDLGRRRKVLSQIDLLCHISDEDLDDLAHHMRLTPFARGEVVHRQGDEAHWLYVLGRGTVEERVSKDGIEETVHRLEAPSFFGEMSLMTGSPRLATVVAVTSAECYRLDKSAFARIIAQPAAAEQIAAVIARRRVELHRAHDELAEEAGRRSLAAAQTDILHRIRAFFTSDQPN